MEKNVPISTLCLYKETRLDLDPHISGSKVRICIPSTATFSRKSPSQRPSLTNLPRFKDEQTFGKHCLASSGSIYLRKSKRYPRTFLWRTLEDSQVLEVRSVDLSKNEREPQDASIILQFSFLNGIRHGGVALADLQDQDILSVFVLTKGNELYTITLRPDSFYHAAALDEDTGKWCKLFKPASFTISTPHRLVACSSLELVVALGDGRLMRLTRKGQDDGSFWHESTYNDGQWGSSLRGLVRWQGSNTVRYDGNALDQTTAIAIAPSPDGNHLYTVCLNHSIKVWNLKTGKVGFTRDLLNKHREPQELPKLMLNPSVSRVLQIFQAERIMDGDEYYFLTFSPHNSGVFKFWAVRDADHGARGIRDLFPEATFRPPDPDPSPESKAIWTVADFSIQSNQKGRETEMWVLMRSNRLYKLYNLKFNLEDLSEIWQHDWSTTAMETLDQQSYPQTSHLEPEDATEVWLKFIFQPSKYPVTVLETALSVYCLGRAVEVPSNPKASLQERVCSAVSARVQLHFPASADVDFEKLRVAESQEWLTFWQDVCDLNRSRWGVVSLAYDDHMAMPWVIFADGCSATRECSRLEIIAQNTPKDLVRSLNLLEAPSVEMDAEGNERQLPDELAILIEAAADFRQSFGHRLQQGYHDTLVPELWHDPSHSVPIRIQTLYDSCDFASHIGDKQFNDLQAALEPIGGFDGLDTNSFIAIFETLSSVMSIEASGLLSTRFGLKVLVKGAQEMIYLHERILLDLLALVVFVDMEVDRDDFHMENFHAGRIYIELLNLLKQYQLMQWLATNIRPEQTHDTQSSATNHKSIISDSSSLSRSSTILENLFAADPKPQSYSTQPQTAALTHSIQDILKWVVGGNDVSITLDRVLVHIQCNLLANSNLGLASDFLRYQPSTAWSTYVKGRLYLARAEYTTAAIYFKKAAFNLSRPSPSLNYQTASSHLLTSNEATHLSSGLSAYYTHIIQLFTPHSQTQTSHFASLALSHPTANPTPLLETLFHSSLATSSFPQAYSALTRLPPNPTHLSTLLQKMLAQNAAPLLLALPFPALHPLIDDILAQKARECWDLHQGPQYHRILAAWRIRHHDFRGAAAVLLERLERMRAVGWGGGGGEEGEEVLGEWLGVVNLMACVGEGEAWVLSGGEEEEGGKRRKVVTIGDVRRGYQEELDRRAVIEGGRFGILGGGGGEEMDIL